MARSKADSAPPPKSGTLRPVKSLRRPPKGMISVWTRLRRWIWFWVPWAVWTLWLFAHDHWWWSAVTGFVAMFMFLASPTEAPPHYGLDHDRALTSDEIIETIAGTTGALFLKGNKLSILKNGDEFYPRMLEAIRGAKTSINIEAYIYWGGSIGREFAGALAERSQNGVAVRILLDAVGSSSIGKDILAILDAGGCRVAWYNPIRWSMLWRTNHRTHRKSLIIDGRVGFTGGAGIADMWLGNARNQHEWRDTQVRLEGPAVTPLQTGFAQNWLQAVGEIITGPDYFPIIEPCGPLAVQTIMSSPEAGASPARLMYYLSIVAARKSIDIANPYFVPDEVAIETLIDAKKRGVRVRIMVSGNHNDNRAARRNSVRLCGALIKEGIEVWEYNTTMLHQKTMVVDEMYSTIGTANFDSRSFAHNEESNICVRDADIATCLIEHFQEDLQACEKLDLRKWRRRPLLIRALEFAAWFIEDQV
jgi:cardiolipin synthase